MAFLHSAHKNNTLLQDNLYMFELILAYAIQLLHEGHRNKCLSYRTFGQITL
mgnify:CR=1 FL=1